MRTDEHRPRQQQKAVGGHTARKRVAFSFPAGGSQAKKNWRVANRIYNRKQSGIDQQEGVDKIRHGAGPTPNGMTLRRNCSVTCWCRQARHEDVPRAEPKLSAMNALATARESPSTARVQRFARGIRQR